MREASLVVVYDVFILKQKLSGSTLHDTVYYPIMRVTLKFTTVDQWHVAAF